LTWLSSSKVKVLL